MSSKLDGNRVVVVCFGLQFLFLLDLIFTLFIRTVHTIHKYPCKQIHIDYFENYTSHQAREKKILNYY